MKPLSPEISRGLATELGRLNATAPSVPQGAAPEMARGLSKATNRLQDWPDSVLAQIASALPDRDVVSLVKAVELAKLPRSYERAFRPATERACGVSTIVDEAAFAIARGQDNSFSEVLSTLDCLLRQNQARVLNNLLSTRQYVMRGKHLVECLRAIIRLPTQHRDPLLTALGDKIRALRPWFGDPGDVRALDEMRALVLDNVPEASRGRCCINLAVAGDVYGQRS